MLRPSASLWRDRGCDLRSAQAPVSADILALHRIRSVLIGEHTALMNQMRGLLAECRIVVALGAAPLRWAAVQSG